MTPELEAAVEEAKRRLGAMSPEARDTMWKRQCESFVRAMAAPSDKNLESDELARRRREADFLYGNDMRWKGEGPAPASWMIGNTKVYRSYADYIED